MTKIILPIVRTRVILLLLHFKGSLTFIVSNLTNTVSNRAQIATGYMLELMSVLIM